MDRFVRAIRLALEKARPWRHRASPATVVDALVRAASEAIVILDSAGRILLLNTSAEQMFGFASDELRGEPLARLLPAPQGGEATGGAAVQLLDSGQPPTGERRPVRARRRTGEVFAAELGIAEARVGRRTYAIAVLRDRTGAHRLQAALQESEARFRGAFDSSATAFVLTEPDGRLRAVNRACCEMLGYTEAELLGRTFQQITHPDDIATDQGLAEDLLAGRIATCRIEKRYIHRSGRSVWADLTVSLVRDAKGVPVQFVAQATDVTARKEAEQALARRAAELERSNAELEQFAYVASHDLQEPLRTVASYAQLLVERYEGELNARGARWIGYITAAVERMHLMTDDLLALAQVHTVVGSLVATDLGGVVARAWDEVCANYGPGPELTQSGLPTLPVNLPQIEQLFRNLLGNALKYRRAEIPLLVHVSAERHPHNGRAEWEFVVQDNGIGFDLAFAGRIFEIFQRLHRGHQYSGTGIGLAICKRVVEGHGGRIWVDSVPGVGSSFHFTLPE